MQNFEDVSPGKTLYQGIFGGKYSPIVNSVYLVINIHLLEITKALEVCILLNQPMLKAGNSSLENIRITKYR